VRGGLGALTDRLAERLEEGLQLSTPVLGLSHTRTSVTLRTASGESVHDHVVITSPQSHARSLLPDAPSGWFDDLPMAPLAAIHLAYDGDAIPGGLPGFGWLAHSAQRRDALGCLWVSGTFPTHAPHGSHLLRVMVGGSRAPELANRSDEALVALARQLLADAQGIDAEPLFTDVNRAAIPQYPLGFARRLRLLRQLHPRIRFAGWSWGHLGVAASIQASARAVKELRSR
jgi:protoporphyrinogen oxidase